MRCALWQVGGSSYSAADAPTEFHSIAAARSYAVAFWRNGYFPGKLATPCAGDVEFHFFRGGVPHNMRDPDPDECWTATRSGNVRRALA